MIPKVKVSHNLTCTIWRPRKAGAVLPIQTPRLEIQEKQRSKSWSESKRTKNEKYWCPKPGEVKVSAQAERTNSLFLFCSLQAFATFMRMYLLPPSRDSNVNLFQRHTHSNGLPATCYLAQLSCCIKLTITPYF
jgi:hypothetical protein